MAPGGSVVVVVGPATVVVVAAVVDVEDAVDVEELADVDVAPPPLKTLDTPPPPPPPQAASNATAIERTPSDIALDNLTIILLPCPNISTKQLFTFPA